MPTRRPVTALALLLALAAGSRAQGRLVRADPGPGVDPEARDEAAMRAVFRDAYNRRFDGSRVMQDDPESVEGAFLVFQRSVLLLASDPESLRKEVEQGGVRAWFDPRVASASPVRPGSRGIAAEELPPARLYAPSYQTLDRFRDLAYRVRQAGREGDRQELAALHRELFRLLGAEIEEMDRLLTREGGELLALGLLEGPDGPRRVRLDPDLLRRALAQLAPEEPEEEQPAPRATLPGALPSGPEPKGSSRSMTEAARRYFRDAAARMGEPMTYQERWRFEMGLENYGFELSSPAQKGEGVLTYTPLHGDPAEVFFGGAANLSNYTRKRDR